MSFKKYDIVEFNGKRFTAVYFDRRGWFFQENKKGKDEPDTRKALTSLPHDVKVVGRATNKE